MRPGATEEVIRLLPEGIGVIPLFLNIRRGARDEFAGAMPAYEQQVALLGEQACDLIHPAGAPPFMVLGLQAEARLIAAWEQKCRTTIFTVAQNHVAAPKALNARTIVGATYFSGEINDVFAQYFTDAGFTVLGMAGLDVPFDQVQNLAEGQVYAHIKGNFLKHKGADAIYLLGSGWRTLPIIRHLERDLQVPVVHPVTARVWEIQKRLHVRQPVVGYGHLLETLP